MFMVVPQEVVALDADTALDVAKLVVSPALNVHVKTGTAATTANAKEPSFAFTHVSIFIYVTQHNVHNIL